MEGYECVFTTGKTLRTDDTRISVAGASNASSCPARWPNIALIRTAI